jgi:signal transduction histidine kinase
MADGRHLWRIIDNLMSNICKYALPGTRVYIDLCRTAMPENGKNVISMTFRNISNDKLNITSEELMARFVRGDSSRNTEGNGLGLSIAKSLSELMNADLRVEIDGDLYKAILSFEEIE